MNLNINSSAPPDNNYLLNKENCKRITVSIVKKALIQIKELKKNKISMVKIFDPEIIDEISSDLQSEDNSEELQAVLFYGSPLI